MLKFFKCHGQDTSDSIKLTQDEIKYYNTMLYCELDSYLNTLRVRPDLMDHPVSMPLRSRFKLLSYCLDHGANINRWIALQDIVMLYLLIDRNNKEFIESDNIIYIKQHLLSLIKFFVYTTNVDIDAKYPVYNRTSNDGNDPKSQSHSLYSEKFWLKHYNIDYNDFRTTNAGLTIKDIITTKYNGDKDSLKLLQVIEWRTKHKPNKAFFFKNYHISLLEKVKQKMHAHQHDHEATNSI